MRPSPSLMPLSLAAITAFVLVASIFIVPAIVLAGQEAKAETPACSCPDAQKGSRPRFADLHGPLDESDEIAALASVQLGLSQTGDGTTFVWRRGNGRLSGTVSPTASFRNAAGTICRHIVVLLTTGDKTKKLEGIACRLPSGRWQLEG